MCSDGSPDGASATSPMREATSTCSSTLLLRYCLLVQSKYFRTTFSNAPIPVTWAADIRCALAKACRHSMASSPLSSTTAKVRCPPLSLSSFCCMGLLHRALLPAAQTASARAVQLAAPRERANPIGSPAGDRLDGQRRIDATDGRKHRTVANPQIGDVPAAAIGIDHAAIGMIPHARGAVQMAGVVVLDPDVAGAGRLQRPGHEFQGVLDQPLVIVAPGIGHARNAQPVLINLVGKGDAVRLLRQHLADDLQADDMIVVLHRLDQAIAPEAARAHQRVGPEL